MKRFPVPLTILVPTLLLAAFGLWQLPRAWMSDLFIHRGGTVLAWQGITPYSPAITEWVDREYAHVPELQGNTSYFLPPQAIVIFAPLAAVPWPTAKMLYLVMALVMVTVCWYGSLAAFRNRPLPPLEGVPPLLPACVMLHLVTVLTLLAGQSTLMAAGAIVAGQLLQQAGRPWLAALFWSVAFVKPHVALPLLPLAVVLDGWSRAARITVWLAVLNLAGCLMATGVPKYALEFFEQLRNAQSLVTFNRVLDNEQIVSWNAIVLDVTGIVVDLSAVTTVLGMAITGAVIALRVALFERRPTDAWLTAVIITGGLVCTQVMGYELFLLVLVVPHYLDLLADRRRVDVAVLGGLLLVQSLPHHLMVAWGWPRYRAWLLLAMAAWLLARPRARPMATGLHNGG
jgi:hypothetical protein